MVGSYNGLLVFFSLIVAMLASYTALDMASRVTRAQGAAARWWLAGGASAMGFGIWSMHFVGMLAFSLPIPLGYDPLITLLSLCIAIASSAFALWIVCQEQLPWRRLTASAVVMGLGVAGMHYTGMAAMLMSPPIHYQPALLVLSVLIAILASGAALRLAFQLRWHSPRVRTWRAGAAVIMGFAIVGMHYTGMAAADFPRGSLCGAAAPGSLSTGWLAVIIILATLAVISIALITSVLDSRLETRTALLSDSLQEANRELSYLALHDQLTKLPNRILLEDRLAQAIQVGEREGALFTLMNMDMDGFKGINDAYGHQLGDRLLVEIAQRLSGTLRAQDTVARLSGDEFMLLAGIEQAADAATIADKLLSALRPPFRVESHELHVSASIGIAVYPDNGNRESDLFANASTAMLHAKELGRNTYCFFESSMNANVHDQLQLLQDLHAALARRELVLYYQPKVAARSGATIGVEALVRWRHPERGLIAPDQFIPLAERTGLIVPLGEWVLDEACRQMAQWLREGRNHWTMAVNLSALQFSHASLVGTVEQTLARHALPAHHLILEITESTAMRDVNASLRILEQLHRLGVKICIDDFGTGYSSLLYLKRLPADELKIDRGFVQDLGRDKDDEAIVRAIVALGQALGLTVVAEGVETREQQDYLAGLGCHLLQGYLLGRPVPAQDLQT